MRKREKEKEKAKRAKRKKQKKLPPLSKLIAEKEVVPINKLHELTDEQYPAFELNCNGDRGRLINISFCGATVDMYSTRHRKIDDESRQVKERVDISCNTPVRLLRSRKKPGRKKRKK
jgi:hypothetical protein